MDCNSSRTGTSSGSDSCRAPVGPPPSVLKTITNPKISRDDKGYYCQVGKYVFLREGRTEETPKLTTQVFSLLSNGTVIDSIKSALDKVLFTKSDTYLESTLTCQVDVGQEKSHGNFILA
jgi:hypothetical protein